MTNAIIDILPHRLPASELSNIHVSDVSLWDDEAWVFPNTTAGRHKMTSRFDFRLCLLEETEEYEAEFLTDERFSPLLDEVKRFVYSMLFDGRGAGGHLKQTGLHNLQVELHQFLRWMVVSGYMSVADVPVDAVNTLFLDHLVEAKVRNDNEDGITAPGLAKYISIPIKLHQQTAAMSSGSPLLKDAPFDGKAAIKIASELCRKSVRSIPALPMSVFVPAVSEALSWVEKKSVDVIALLDLYRDQWESLGDKNPSAKQACVGEVLRDFKFTTLPSQAAPWRDPLDGYVKQARRASRIDADGSVDTFHQVRRLVQDTRDACVCLIQALLGLRISEVCGLRALPRHPETGIPACIEIEDTVNGVYEAFYVKGRVFKGEDIWQEVRWAAGLRPKGSSEIPPAIAAVFVLEEMFRPFREMGDLPDLIVGFRNPQGLPKEKASITHVMSDALRDGQRWWISTYTAVSPNVHITTHMWRKTYALQIYKADPRLLPAISQHFKHLDLQTTYESYVRGADPDLLHFVDDVSFNQTAELLMDIRHGRVPAAGRVYESLLDGASQFDGYFGEAGVTTELDAIQRELDNTGVRAHECGWGRCLYRPEWARCGGGLLGPNESNRSPSICAGCDNMVILLEHRDFWLRRKDSNLQIAQEFERTGNIEAAVVPRDRVAQCEQIIRLMNGRNASV